MKMLESRDLILAKGKVCDHCLGRQFRNKFKDHANDQVGAAVRKAKKEADIEKALKKKMKPKLLKSCFLCGGIFAQTGKFSKLLKKEALKQDFETFLVGCKINKDLIDREEKLWEGIGAENCEPIKREINRTFGIMVWEWTDKKAEFNFPDVIFTLDFKKGRIEVKLNPLYIYARYRKLVRGIPQTKWPCRECGGRGCEKCGHTGKQYKETVEELIAEKALEETGGKSSSFHGEGREDIDARMLGRGRPFILEIFEPKKRKLDLKKLEKSINKFAKGKVEVSGLRRSDKKEVQLIKAMKHEKTYEALIECADASEEDLKKLEEYFKNRLISQKTPTRVLHRRADKVRKRKVASLECTLVKGGFRAKIIADAGTYIKELVNGDSGRTEPSFSALIKKPCIVKELDVMEISEG
jgi:tRNA pseudouridine synthase 10